VNEASTDARGRYGGACKTAYTGSIPVVASKFPMLLTVLVRPRPGPNLLYHFGHPHNLLEWVMYIAVMGAFIGIILFVAWRHPDGFG
jgi:hypothetical protein